jgi:predicted MFS family arabinose efflux permease
MLTIAVGAYICGLFLDWGYSARTIAAATGMLMLLPAALWAWGMRMGAQSARLETKAAD